MDTELLLRQGQQVRQQEVLEHHLQAVRQELQEKALHAVQALSLDYIQPQSQLIQKQLHLVSVR